MKKFLFPFTVAILAILSLLPSCNRQEAFYTMQDFPNVPKTDVHLHYYTKDVRFLEFAANHNFRILSPNVESSIPLDIQWDISRAVMNEHPNNIAFLVSFPSGDFDQPGFAERTISHIEAGLKEGASGVKIWKNIGMTIQDKDGRYVMADDPIFEPIFQYLEKNRIPLMAHLGEPRNCWLPLEEMTDGGDRAYYSEHPQYHMYLHPEMPSYEDQIETRDNLLEKYPGMVFTGAHLGSLEWNVDELAKRLDKFPHFSVDMSARIGHLRNQSKEDYERVRQFMITYQDRLMYGTDLALHDAMLERFDEAAGGLLRAWMNDWAYLATDSTIREVKGLQLPAAVVDKIFYTNARNTFKLK